MILRNTTVYKIPKCGIQICYQVKNNKKLPSLYKLDLIYDYNRLAITCNTL